MPCLIEPLRIPTLHVADIELQREVDKLYELAYNLWWTWNSQARELFAVLDPEKWDHYANPVEVLINLTPRHWSPFLDNEDFLARYRRVTDAFERYLAGHDATWYHRQGHCAAPENGPIAYFSMEYGLHQSLVTYSGGLGILSGDHCKSASDLGVPLVAVGLLYRHGYFQQTIDAEGLQQHTYPDYDFTRLPLRPAAGRTGREVVVEVPLPGRDLRVKVWLAQIGRVPLLLLDTNLPENDPADRPISDILYVSGREMRLAQELVLGLGGVRALRALGLAPAVWHLNEGHCAFLQLERLREIVQDDGGGLNASRVGELLSNDAVFTTHTPVPAGNEVFPPEMVEKYLSTWCDEVGLPPPELRALGQAPNHPEDFNLTALAIRTTRDTNGVSWLNAQVAGEMWRPLLPAGTGEAPVRAITNGIHTPSWIGREMAELFCRYLGQDWPELLLEPAPWEAMREVPDAEIWAAHVAQKERLGRYTRRVLRTQLARHGASPDELRSVGGCFDPAALTIGFARRFATYKRAKLIFSDLERLRQLLADDERPMQILFAGKAHPADRPGQQLIQHIFELSRSETFKGRIFFLENYDFQMGRRLVQGVDVWLNNPRRPLEASGTSGQKAAANGVLNCSILDGWWPEGFNGHNGWAIGTETASEDEGHQDWQDAQSLYTTLTSEIVPLFWDRDGDDLPRGWIATMKEAIATLTPTFSASRMVRDYVERAYLSKRAPARPEPLVKSSC